MMSTKRTLAAAAIFALLVVLYMADGRRRSSADASRQRATHPFGTDAGKITVVTMERMGEKVEFVRENGAWNLREPIQTLADPERIRNILDLLVAQETTARQLASNKDLEAFGLAKPAYSITAQTDDGPRGIVFGQEAPIEGRVYARMRDDPEVFTISRELAETVILPLNDLRDRRLLPLNVTEADAFTITFEGRTLEASRDGDKWRITQPVQVEADAEVMREFLGAIQISRAEDFVETGTQELAALGLDAPAIAAFVNKGAERHSLLIGHRRLGGDSPVYYAKRGDSPVIFTVTQTLFMLLQARASDLRNKDVFTLAREDAAAFELVFGSAVTRLRKDPQGAWHFDESGGRRVDQDFVEQLLTRIFRMSVADYLETQPTPDVSGMESPYVRLTISNADGTRAEGIETGRPHPQNADQVFARRTGAVPSEVFLISADEPGHFFLAPEAFADKTLFSFDPAAVKAFTITANNQLLTFQREQDAWVASLAGGKEFFQIKSALTERFLGAVTGLKFKSRLDPADEADAAMIAKSGLEKPNGTFAFFDEGGAELGRFAQGGFQQSTVLIRRGEDEIFATERVSYAAFVNALTSLVKMK